MPHVWVMAEQQGFEPLKRMKVLPKPPVGTVCLLYGNTSSELWDKCETCEKWTHHGCISGPGSKNITHYKCLACTEKEQDEKSLCGECGDVITIHDISTHCSSVRSGSMEAVST
ncbi:hypothetical protein ACLB2K_055388 [Fragaria x ananassa]